MSDSKLKMVWVKTVEDFGKKHTIISRISRFPTPPD
jgi:hypothetical protein